MNLKILYGMWPMNNDAQNKNSEADSCNLPIYGVQYADGELVPFAELYLDLFPEQYAVE